MKLLDRIKNWWSGPVEPEPAQPVAPQSDQAAFRESAGVNIDADEDEWRRLSGDGRRDLAPLTQQRMLRLAHFLRESNLLANRLVELPVAYLLAGGVAWRVDDEEAQKALNRHWNDGINAYKMKLPKRVRELGLFGEQCYPVFVNEVTGFVRLGYLDPVEIATVVTDPDNREQPIGVVTRKNDKGVARRYRIIVNVPEKAFAEKAQAIRETMTDGDCFYFRVNDLCSTTRGRSDLLAQMDWLDAYDQFLFGEVERATGMRAYMWDVTLTGSSPEEVAKRAKEISAPRAGAVRVHNENETWKAESPSLQAYDAERAARLVRNHMLGGATVPEHWYGGAETVNRATGDSMTEPTEKVLLMRRTMVGYMLEEIGKYALRAKWHALDRELSENEQAILDTLKIDWPELTAKDTTKYAAAIQQLTAAAAQAIAEGLLSRETALRILAAMTQRLGVEIDVEDELEKAQAELAERGGNDLDELDLNPAPAAPPIPAPDVAAAE
ncbi:MAG: hypothetical protein IJI03_17190 [Rudaea sp.]|nr:hypothetical protein [Rudaea sp.]